MVGGPHPQLIKALESKDPFWRKVALYCSFGTAGSLTLGAFLYLIVSIIEKSLLGILIMSTGVAIGVYTIKLLRKIS